MAAEAVPAAAAMPVDSCAICRGTNFVEDAVADQALSSKPIVYGYGHVGWPEVKVHPGKRIDCASLVCHGKFHAGCIVGGGDGSAADALIDVPSGWTCFCTCKGTLRFKKDSNNNNRTLLACVPALNSMFETKYAWPSVYGSQLVVNGLIAPVLQPTNNKPAGVLDMTSVTRAVDNVVTYTTPPGPDKSRQFLLALSMTPMPTPQQLVGAIIARRSISPSFALYARMVSQELSRRTGRFLGAADASLVSVKRIWRASPATKEAPIRNKAPLPVAEGPHQVPIALPWSGALPGVVTCEGPAGETAPIDEDVVVETTTLSLKDPSTHSNIKIPARGEGCLHDSIFDLDTYVRANSVANSKLMCPICGLVCFFSSVVIDSFVQGIMRCISKGQQEGTRIDAERAALFSDDGPGLVGALRIPLDGLQIHEEVEGVVIRMDGSWKAKMVEVEVIVLDEDTVSVQMPPTAVLPEAGYEPIAKRTRSAAYRG